MKGVKVFMLIIISVALILSSLVYLTGMCIEKTILSNSYYNGLVTEVGLSYHVHKELQESLPEMMMGGMMEDIPEDELIDEEIDEEIVRERINIIVETLAEALDVEWLNNQISFAIEDVLNWVKGESDVPTMVIDLRERKEIFKEKFTKKVKSYSNEELEKMDLNRTEIGMFREEILRELDIPDQLELSEALMDNAVFNEIEHTVMKIQMARKYFSVLLYVLISLFLLFYLLLAKISGLKWFGASILISGALFFIGLFWGREIIESQILGDIGANVPVDLETLNSLITYTFRKLFVIPLVYSLSGFIILFAGVLYKMSLNKVVTRKQN